MEESQCLRFREWGVQFLGALLNTPIYWRMRLVNASDGGEETVANARCMRKVGVLEVSDANSPAT